MRKIGIRGMTLLEVLAVILILSILAGFASLGMEMIGRERVSSAARELYADLQKARLDAMTQGGKGFGIRLDSPNSYVIFRFEDCNEDYFYDHDACAGGTREEAGIVRKSVNSAVMITITNLSAQINSNVRIFDRFGSPRSANWGMGNVTFVVKGNPDAGLAKCVTISTNRIREGVWTGSHCN